MAADMPAVVMDCGSGVSKCGLAGHDEPTVVFPTLVGRADGTVAVGKSVYDAVDSYSGVCRPVERGLVTDWDDMTAVWRHAFTSMGINPAGRAVVLADSPTNTRASREHTAQVMFETFNTGAAYIANQSVLALYATGRVTGLVLDCGHGVTHAVPVYEGFAIPDSVIRLELGGHDLTTYVAKLLAQHGHAFPSPGAEIREAQQIKETACRVAMDYSDPPAGGGEYKLPDGRRLALPPAVVHCPELLYQPGLAGVESPGVTGLVQAAIQACEIDLRADLYRNVIVVGGSTLFTGFQERTTRELTALHKAGVRVVAPQRREIYTWIGGSTMAALPEFSKQLITKKDYDESGPSIIHTKCA